MSRTDSRVRSPGTFTCARCPAARSALDAVPEAYHNPAAVWWGAFAASAVIRDQVVIIEPVAGLLGQQHWATGLPAWKIVGRTVATCPAAGQRHWLAVSE